MSDTPDKPMIEETTPRLRALRPMWHERLIDRRVVSSRLVYLEAVYLNAPRPDGAGEAALSDFVEVLVPDQDDAVLSGQQAYLTLGPQNRLREESGKSYTDIRGLYAVLLMDGAFKTRLVPEGTKPAPSEETAPKIPPMSATDHD